MLFPCTIDRSLNNLPKSWAREKLSFQNLHSSFHVPSQFFGNISESNRWSSCMAPFLKWWIHNPIITVLPVHEPNAPPFTPRTAWHLFYCSWKHPRNENGMPRSPNWDGPPVEPSFKITNVQHNFNSFAYISASQIDREAILVSTHFCKDNQSNGDTLTSV